MSNFDDEYEAMIQENFATITHINCRRRSNKNCYNGQALQNSVYGEEGEKLSLEAARENYLSDGTLADDGSIVCDACYAGF